MENKKDFIKGWVLVIVAIVFTILYFFYTYTALKDTPPEDWNFGTTPFVPGSSIHAVERFEKNSPELPIINKDTLNNR